MTTVGTGSTRFVRDLVERAKVGRQPRRRTRIVATIGPACEDEATIAAMAQAGMDVARVPLAHGSLEHAIEVIKRIRSAAPEIGVLADLPGPKVRATHFPEGGIILKPGDEVLLVPGSVATTSDSGRIGVTLDEVIDDLVEGDQVAIGDGGVSLVVLGRSGEGALTRVRSGGRVQGAPGVTVPTSRIHLPTPTPEDERRIEALVKENVDFIAVSFVREAADIERARELVGSRDILLVAKIETREGIDNLAEICRATDAVMVARGDLGVRVPLEDVPLHQKHIIRSGVRFARPVITATQMLESMVTASVPTRAEVTDVANAVLDGTSAVMLSGETAIGVDPVGVVETMARIVVRTEREFDFVNWGANIGVQEISGAASSPAGITATITGAAWRAAAEQDTPAIIACTRSGATARAISRFRPAMTIVAATPSIRTARQLSMSWGVETLLVRESTSTDDIVWFAVKDAVAAGYATQGDVVVVLAGSPNEPDPVADTLRLVRVD